MDLDLNQISILRIILTLVLFIASVPVYYYYARKYQWIDVPNERSSHQKPTYRGFGILFLNSLWLFPDDYHLLCLGLVIAALTGFIDDIRPLKAAVRALLYTIALVLAFWNIPDIRALNPVFLVLAMIIGLGTVNAVNFMDGINGISVFYAIVCQISVGYATYSELLPEAFWDLTLPLTVILIIFAFFNARSKALAFMGDAGSVFLGLWMVFCVVYLCLETRSLLAIAMLMIYGVDTVLTIIERLIRRENIFKAHRRHLYQLLSNELKYSHFSVALGYALAQGILNIILFTGFRKVEQLNLLFFMILIATGITFTAIKFLVLRKIETNQVLK